MKRTSIIICYLYIDSHCVTVVFSYVYGIGTVFWMWNRISFDSLVEKYNLSTSDRESTACHLLCKLVQRSLKVVVWPTPYVCMYLNEPTSFLHICIHIMKSQSQSYRKRPDHLGAHILETFSFHKLMKIFFFSLLFCSYCVMNIKLE
jgi:hypothetical protein